MLQLIVSMTPSGVIGHHGDQPWSIPEDLALFKTLTMGAALIVGEVTWLTPALGHPLPGREIIVLSTTVPPEPGVQVVDSLPKALALAATISPETFVIGGRSVYEQTLPLAERLHISRLHAEVPGDTSFPAYNPANWEKIEEKTFAQFTYEKYKRKNVSNT